MLNNPILRSIKKAFLIVYKNLFTDEWKLTLVGQVLILSILTFVGLRVVSAKEVTWTTDSGTISISSGNEKTALILLSPNGGNEITPWVNTGVTVKKGDRISITASGRVNTAAKRMLAQTIKPEIHEQTWTEPKGLAESSIFILPLLNNSKLLPDDNNHKYGFGMLLAGIMTSEDAEKIAETEANVKEQDIWMPANIHHFTTANCNSHHTAGCIEFSPITDGELVLTVNDIWLSEADENIYVPSLDLSKPDLSEQDDFYKYYLEAAKFDSVFADRDSPPWTADDKNKKVKEAYEKRKENWKIISQTKNWNIWYEDNIGSFSVAIDINP